MSPAENLRQVPVNNSDAGVAAGRKFWATVCNPDRYRFDDEYRSVAESVWMVPRGAPRAGDGLLVWLAGGKRKTPRGVVAIGMVLTDPEVFAAPPQLNQFWVEPQPNAAARRIWIRYERCPGLPLLLGGPHDSLLQQLSVSRAQGTGAFRVTDEQWQQLVEAAGGIPEAAEQPDVTSEFAEGLTEGGKKLLLHWKIERSPELARRKKERVQRDVGCLACECCGFDFASFYGPGGEGYIEVHHRRPLHTLTHGSRRRLADQFAGRSDWSRVHRTAVLDCFSDRRPAHERQETEESSAETSTSPQFARRALPGACTQSIRSRHNCSNSFMDNLIRGNLETGGHRAPDYRP